MRQNVSPGRSGMKVRSTPSGSTRPSISGWVRSYRPQAIVSFNLFMISQDNAWIADTLIAVDQVDLLGLYFPGAGVADDAMPGPAGEPSGLVAPEFADQEIRPHHARVVTRRGENLDIGDEPHGA